MREGLKIEMFSGMVSCVKSSKQIRNHFIILIWNRKRMASILDIKLKIGSKNILMV